jgi:putative RNA 2'-phosphotransferase
MDKLIERVSRVRLSQLISHALRHHPDRYSITLSTDGYASLQGLSDGLTKQLGYEVPLEEVIDIITVEGGTRYTVKEDQVRAEYGHTQPVSIVRSPSKPPEFLYHGTLKKYIRDIKLKGLLKHNLQYVHLSATPEFASEVGSRRGKSRIVKVRATQAAGYGLSFYKASEDIWLVKYVPREFLEFLEFL